MGAITPYQRLKNFTQYALDHTSATYNASDHDAELDAVALTLSGLVTNINLIQRNDGLLANNIVGPDAITTQLKALIGAGSTGNLNWKPRGLWITATAYALGDVVEQASTSYVCSLAHNSGVFATDKAAGKWVTLGGLIVTLAASAVTFTPAGNIAATDVQTALQEIDVEKALLAGLTTQVFSVAAASASAHAVRLDQAQNNSLFFAAGTGSGNALAATINPAGFTVLPDGFECCIRAPGANSITNPTFNLTLAATATGAKTIVRGDNGGVLQVGDIVGSSHELRFRYRASTDKWLLLNAGNVPISINNVPSQQGLVDYLHIDSDTGHRDLIRGGYVPAFYNQGWGGAPHYFELADEATGATYKFEAASGYLEDTVAGAANVANAAGNTWCSQGFKVSKNTTLAAVWVKIYKTGSPTNNLECRILPDSGAGTTPNGSVAIANGTATAQGGKLHSADTNGQWVRFVFPTPPSLIAGTQYHITLKSSGAVDAANFWVWKATDSKKYPHGNFSRADGTPTWTAITTSAQNFLAEIAAADESLTTGGIFSEGKLTFFEGSPLNQSNARVKDLRDFTGLDLTDFTLALFGNSWTKDKTILDITYGLDHDRIVLRCNVTTGVAQIDLYDSAGNKKTVTGTVDVSGANSLLAVRVRAKGDGNDVVELWENGVKAAASLAAQTISFDKLFGQARIGTLWLGGGWQVTPAWTKDTAMGSLPSADGWTYTGTPVEASAFNVSGGKLFQNRNAFGSLDLGYYSKAALALSNVNGWAVASKVRAAFTVNNSGGNYSLVTLVDDGTKQFPQNFQEYFSAALLAASSDMYAQLDNKTNENVHAMIAKGSDYFAFANGRLTMDGTGRLSLASGSNGVTANSIRFGDMGGGAAENADAVWDYVKYYNTAWLPPQCTAGVLSEFAIWNGDRTSLLATLWNAGSPISVKQLCGMTVNTGPEVVQRVRKQGITANPTTTNTAFPPPTVLEEMDAFILGSNLAAQGPRVFGTSSLGTNSTYGALRLDGALNDRDGVIATVGGSGGYYLHTHFAAAINFGLHKVECTWGTSAGTATAQVGRRRFEVEARA